MVEKGVLTVKGLGRSTAYELSVNGRIFAEVDAQEYLSVEPDKRYGLRGYNFDLFSSFPPEVFLEEELEILNEATREYKEKTKNISLVIEKKELERFVIELSWKSSKIEGNTYTLLDTEKLILKNEPAEGKTKQETQMILNHKNAFHFVYNNKMLFKTLTRENLEELHKMLVKKLDIALGLRKSSIGVSGSVYRPLDNIYQVSEAVEALVKTINQMKTTYAKSTVALLGISYIQPFDDGNKRTSRIMADALLMANNFAPLSYRSVDEKEYKEAVLTFYELNSIVPFKKIFIEQYNFSARNYAVK
jgi:Fic family protein